MNDEIINKSYYAVLPSNVRYDNRLKDKAKLLYAEITSLTNEKGFCWASNNYFAELYSISKGTVSKLLSELKKYGYINIELIYKDNTKEVKSRIITLLSNSTIPIVEKDNNIPIVEIDNTYCQFGKTPMVENDKENIININNINNILNHFSEKNCFSNITKLTDSRKKKLLARIKEHGEENIIKAIDIASNSDFLKGKNDHNWKMDFDWLIANDTNIVKILEGKYSNKLNESKSEKGRMYGPILN